MGQGLQTPLCVRRLQMRGFGQDSLRFEARDSRIHHGALRGKGQTP
jgi:hypothetical protein